MVEKIDEAKASISSCRELVGTHHLNEKKWVEHYSWSLWFQWLASRQREEEGYRGNAIRESLRIFFGMFVVMVDPIRSEAVQHH